MYGEIYATENLVTFIDAILQFVIFGTFKKRVLELPSRLHRVVIDPHKYKELKQSLSKDQSEYRLIGNFFLFEKPQSSKASVKNFFSEFLPISHYKDMKTVYCGGIEITGIQTTLASYRQFEKATPLIKKYTFVPFETDQVGIFYEY